MSGNPLNPINLLGRQAIREIGRATIDATSRKLTGVQIVGATVRAATPGAGTVTVHIDGDPPADARQVPVATWEFYDVGQRVYVVLFPPSGAMVVGPAGGAPPWTAYPADAPDPAFYSAQNKTPTITEKGASGDRGLFPGTNATTTTSSINLPADTIIVLCVGTRSPNDYKQVSSFSHTGTQLSWTNVAGVTRSGNGGGAPTYMYGGMWYAYNESSQNVTFTFTWDDTTTGAKAFVSVLACADAKRVQVTPGSASATQASGGGGSVHTVNVTTTVNYAQIVGLCVGADDDFDAGGFDWSAASGCTIISEDSSDDGYSGMVTVRRTSGVATPAATTIGATGTAVFADNDESGLVIGLEVQGEPAVPVAGDGTFLSSYRLVGKTLHQRLTVVGGSTTTYGAGNLGLHLPPGMVASSRPAGGIQTISGALRTATNFYRLVACITAGQAYFDKVLYQDGATTYLTATTPATLGSTTLLSLEGAIEIG